MLSEYLKALLLIFIAEMGDKTQILAMIFSTRYPVKKVLLGVTVGSFMNHGVAVLFGKYIGSLIPAYLLQMIAGIAFLGFAMWTVLEKDKETDTVEKKLTKSAIVTVALAFFIGELGDKTQLTAITLSVDALFPVFILMGTVSGMVVTSALGIFVGSKVGHKMPDALLKILAAGTFMIFGLVKLLSAMPKEWLVAPVVLIISIVTVGIVLKMCINFISWRTLESKTTYQKAAQRVYHYFNGISLEVNNLCKGQAYCGQCQGLNCGVGYLKYMVSTYIQTGIIKDHEQLKKEVLVIKDKFSVAKLIQLLQITIDSLLLEDNLEIQYVREILELLLFDKAIEWTGNKKDYVAKVKSIHVAIGSQLEMKQTTR